MTHIRVPAPSPTAVDWPAVPSGDVLVRVRGLVKHFPVQSAKLLDRGREVVHAVEGVDLDVRRGETLGIVGETGCGKSTLARCVARLYDVTAGQVIFDGRDITRHRPRQMRPLRREVQMIFQDPYGSLNPRRRIGSIIGDPFAIHGLADGAARKRRVQELMEVVGLKPEHYNRFPAEFSGGQRQRIGVARALALRPKLIICDEPVSALDVSIQAQIINLLADLQSEFKLTYMFIAHDLSVVRHVSDRVAVMYLGRIAEIGPTAELYSDPRHPYTNALLSAVPVPDPGKSRGRRRIVLTGDVPSPIHPPTGCPFHPRCPKARADCVSDDPALVPRLGDGPQHLAACLHPVAAGDDLAGRQPNTDGSERAGTVPGADGVPDRRIDDADLAISRSSFVGSPLGEGIAERRAEEGARVGDGALDGVQALAPPVVPGEEELPEAARVIEGRSPWRLAYERLRLDRAAMISLGVIVFIIVVAIAAPVVAAITGHGPDQQFRTAGLHPDGLPVAPNSQFLLGTDDLGRDILVRIAYGARISLLVGVVATLLEVFIGTVLGLAAGYFGKLVDTVIARLVDIVLSIPFLLFGLSLVAISHPSLKIVILVIVMFGWAAVARIVRGQVLSIREKEHIEAARSLGAGPWRIMFIDILPNVVAPIVVYVTLLIPVAIVLEATLSYLGVGVPPPTADWGQMIAESQQVYQQAWWFLVFPSVALLVTTVAFNVFGDGVRDALDPRTQQLFT